MKIIKAEYSFIIINTILNRVFMYLNTTGTATVMKLWRHSLSVISDPFPHKAGLPLIFVWIAPAWSVHQESAVSHSRSQQSVAHLGPADLNLDTLPQSFVIYMIEEKPSNDTGGHQSICKITGTTPL